MGRVRRFSEHALFDQNRLLHQLMVHVGLAVKPVAEQFALV